MNETVIIGAGQGAVEVAFGLRANGYQGSVHIIGEEAYPPYQRPPLSKGYLLGDIAQERLFFKDKAIYEDAGIDLSLATKVIAVDSEAQIVRFDNSKELRFDNLILATGSRPRLLPLEGADASNIFSLRSMQDIHAIQNYMQKGSKLTIIGGGYIGLELAAVGAKLGLEVHVVEMMPRLLARVARAQTAALLHQKHAENGVHILLETGVNGLVHKENKVQAVALSDGSELPTDFVVVGIGAIPNQELAVEAGVKCANGILIDENCATSIKNIYAAGDVSCFQHPRYGDIRLESVGNAIDQGQRIAQAICKKEVKSPAMPWFWSDQYDYKMQSAGLVMHDNVEIITRKGERENAQSLWIYDDKGLLSVEAVNDPKSYLMGKRWLEQGISPDKNAIMDESVNLKECPVF